MSEYLFVFDLDATVTKKEILPEIAQVNDQYSLMRKMTENAMNGKIDFESSFRERVALLKDIPVSKVQQIVKNIPLNNQIVDFIKQNIENCRIITGNLDIWICQLIKTFGMESNYFSSKGLVENDRLTSIIKIIDKKDIVNSFCKPFIAVGDGHNDLPMIEAAHIGIGFGGVRDIAPSVKKAADYNIKSEKELCLFLQQFV